MLERIKLNIMKFSEKIFIPLLILFSIARSYIGYYILYWFFIRGTHDDLVFFSYADLNYHFTHWNINSLVKTMSYPLFLFFVKISHIPYGICLSILWIISGLFVIYAVYKFISKNKLWLLLIFIFIIFMPIAFDIYAGMRVYRNAIMIPSIISCLTSLFIFISLAISKNKNIKQLVLWAIILGVLFTFNYYIKEDGILTMPIFATSIACVILYNFYENRSKKMIKYAVICLIPILIFGASTLTYKEINNHYFGIDEINTRTGGEMGEFWENLLKIDDSTKNNTIWVTSTTLEKAWDASPTLQSRPDLFNSMIKSKWTKNLTTSPIKGDHVAWMLRHQMAKVGLYSNEKQANDFMKQVNDELEMSFENGTLKKSEKIFITPLANGKSLSEINDNKNHYITGFENCLFYKHIDTENHVQTDSSRYHKSKIINKMEKNLNQPLYKQTEIKKAPFNQKIVYKFIDLDIQFYQVISYLLVALSCISFIYSTIYQFKNKFKNRQNNILIGFEFMLLATFIVQIFAIGWFCCFLSPIESMKYYTIANNGIFALFEILAISGAIKIFMTKKKNQIL